MKDLRNAADQKRKAEKNTDSSTMSFLTNEGEREQLPAGNQKRGTLIQTNKVG
ncbi:MAG: hypothetical protein F6K19_19020 [Cyanothece sp. SIO1E1]|nr:hypothetical protein [Cyanothece sp. SIO1E1]